METRKSKFIIHIMTQIVNDVKDILQSEKVGGGKYNVDIDYFFAWGCKK